MCANATTHMYLKMVALREHLHNIYKNIHVYSK